MVVLRGGAVSHERGTPAAGASCPKALRPHFLITIKSCFTNVASDFGATGATGRTFRDVLINRGLEAQIREIEGDFRRVPRRAEEI